MPIPWPDDLPECPILDGMSYQEEQNLDAFKAELGPPLVGPRGSDAGAFTTLRFLMTRAQVVTFRDWYRDPNFLNFGAENFTLTDPITRTLVEFQLIPESPPEYNYHSPGKLVVALQVYRLPVDLETIT